MKQESLHTQNTCIPPPCLSFACTLFVMIGNIGFVSICHQLSPTVWANQLLLFLGSCHPNGQYSNVRTKPVLLYLTDHHCEYELYMCLLVLYCMVLYVHTYLEICAQDYTSFRRTATENTNSSFVTITIPSQPCFITAHSVVKCIVISRQHLRPIALLTFWAKKACQSVFLISWNAYHVVPHILYTKWCGDAYIIGKSIPTGFPRLP